MSAGTWRRAPAVAGSFYPASGRELARRVAGHLEQGRFRALVARSAGLVRSVKAVIVPHAGYQYSGPVAGTAFAAVAADARRIERVVLIGPSHFVGFDGVALSSAGCFTTPLGDVRLDADLPRALADLPGAVTLDRAHEREHSLEVELPFLQAVLGDFVLAPLVVGDASPATVGAVLGRLWGGEETLVVVSTDLSHYLDYEHAREADAVTIDRIERRKHVGANQACGYRAVNGLLEVLQTKDLNARALDTRNSGDTAGDRDRVVGYGAFVTGAAIVVATACSSGAPDAAAPQPMRSDTVAERAVWIDVDPSVAPGGYELIINDDGLALAQAFHSPELRVRGVSAVFGNAPLEEAARVAAEVVRRFGPPGMTVPVGASAAGQLDVETDATRALAAALSEEPLTILALGPGSNVASVLVHHPELSARIEAIVAVAGRRPGQRFVASTTTSEPLMDFNFEMDPEAFRVLLDSAVPIVLAPFEVSSKVLLTAEDMGALRSGSDATRWLAGPAAGWLDWWKSRFGTDGFYPFDTLAVAYLTSPQWLTWEDLPVQIVEAPDDVKMPALGARAPVKPYLVVSSDAASTRRVRYLFDVDARFKDDLVRRLLGRER